VPAPTWEEANSDSLDPAPRCPRRCDGRILFPGHQCCDAAGRGNHFPGQSSSLTSLIGTGATADSAQTVIARASFSVGHVDRQSAALEIEAITNLSGRQAERPGFLAPCHEAKAEQPQQHHAPRRR
jgi:hypothetical protein